MDLAYCNDRLSRAGVKFDARLSSQEFESIEQRFRFHFPTDLRDFLAYSLPVSTGWIDWRNEDESVVIQRLKWPFQGMRFDIEQNSFWLESWAVKPAKLGEAIAIARAAIDVAPKLIPIYSHRYMPDRPSAAGNPVLSVYQTDIIYYGADLFDYIAQGVLLLLRPPRIPSRC